MSLAPKTAPLTRERPIVVVMPLISLPWTSLASDVQGREISGMIRMRRERTSTLVVCKVFAIADGPATEL